MIFKVAVCTTARFKLKLKTYLIFECISRSFLNTIMDLLELCLDLQLTLHLSLNSDEAAET